MPGPLICKTWEKLSRLRILDDGGFEGFVELKMGHRELTKVLEKIGGLLLSYL
jgi:hypothetical protein